MTQPFNASIKRRFTGLFILLTIGFVLLMALNRDFFNWAFARHQNMLSWAVRPFILLPICYFAYKRSALGISIVAFLGLTSMLWFPVPASVHPQVQDFLVMEKAYLTTGWSLGKITFSLLVPLSMYLLGLAFWKRNVKYGIGIIVTIAVAKTLWSVIEGGKSGQAVIMPAVIGLIISIGAITYSMKRAKKNIQRDRRDYERK